MPPCPVCRHQVAADGGLRLFQSANECPICMEVRPNMIAMPCGHQSCGTCLEKIGIRPRGTTFAAETKSTPVRAPPAPSLPLRLPHIPLTIDLTGNTYRRRVAARVRRRLRFGRRRRCGWCGHAGHTIRRCREHRTQCGCSSFKSAGHKRKLGRKRKCSDCGKKGHGHRTCLQIVRGFR